MLLRKRIAIRCLPRANLGRDREKVPEIPGYMEYMEYPYGGSPAEEGSTIDHRLTRLR